LDDAQVAVASQNNRKLGNNVQQEHLDTSDVQQEQIVEPNDVQQEQNEKLGIKRKQKRRQRKLVKSKQHKK